MTDFNDEDSKYDTAIDDFSESYTYPDENDQLTTQLIDSHDDLVGADWGFEEKKVLNRLKKIISENIKRKDSQLIDFGCGDARLIIEFENYFDKIIGIEPDKRRFENAKNAVNSDQPEKIIITNKLIENTDYHETADAILLSHVIQHINPKNIEKIIQKVHSSLKDAGIFYLATNNSTDKDRDQYTKMYFENVLHEETIDENEFIQLIQNKLGVLPIHWFSKKTLTELLERNGFEIMFYKTFHKSHDNNDRDVAIICRKLSSKHT